MEQQRTESGQVGDWLWHGGRMRVLQSFTTNGGKVFGVGEIIRLVRLEPYGENERLATAWYVSEADPTKGTCMIGWEPSDDHRFELIK